MRTSSERRAAMRSAATAAMVAAVAGCAVIVPWPPSGPPGRDTARAQAATPPKYHGHCILPPPVVADPFPRATDTTESAMAIARAQAAADAAMKNNQALAAYSACMVSDTAG